MAVAAILLGALPASALVPTDPASTSTGVAGWWGSPQAAMPDVQLMEEEANLEEAAGIWIHSIDGDGTDLLSLTPDIIAYPEDYVVGSELEESAVPYDTLAETLYGGNTTSPWAEPEGLGQQGLDRGHRHRHGGGDDGLPEDPTNPVPEPATVMLLASGLLGLGVVVTLRSRMLASMGAEG